MRTRLLYSCVLLVGLVFFAGWTMNAGEAWFKGVIYAGSSKVAITNSTGNLNTTSGSFSTSLSAGTTITAGTYFIDGVSGTVSAAGSSKTDCTALTKGFNVVTSATALQGVCLLTATAGVRQRVYNATSVSVVVYPLDAGNDTLSVDNFSALAADAGWVVGPKGSLDCVAADSTNWSCRSVSGAKAAVAAAGTTIADATALTSVNLNSEVSVTAADGTKGITLPTGTYPGCIRIMSRVTSAANTLKVYGNNSDDDTINGAAADAAYVQMAGTSMLYCTSDGVAWITY